MTFEEAKEKYEKRFNRKLSDKEVAEIALNRMSECETENYDLNDQLTGVEAEVSELKKELEEGITNEAVRMVAVRMEEIMLGKADSYEFFVRIGKIEAPSISYTVKNESITEGEDDYGEYGD